MRYIHENPGRSWLRHSHRAYFQRVSEVAFLGRTWYGYGNAALLQLPSDGRFHRCGAEEGCRMTTNTKEQEVENEET